MTPRRGRQTFRRHVEEKWLPHHVVEPTTREKYSYYLNAHIMPEFGPMRMIDILPEHVCEWITKMAAKGASTWTIQYCKYSIPNSIFTTATLEDPGDHLPPQPWGTDSPLAAFAGLSVGLLVLKMTRQGTNATTGASTPTAALARAPAPVSAGRFPGAAADAAPSSPAWR